MADLLDELGLLLGPPSKDSQTAYERVAPSYKRFRALRMRLAGKPVNQAMLENLRASLQPGRRILAGCGTGARSRQIQALQAERCA